MALLAGLAVFGLAKALKLWAIASLGERWSFRVLVLPGRALVARGPYRWMRHPNYLAVLGEISGVALTVWALVTGPLALAGFGALMWRRIGIEDRALDRRTGPRGYPRRIAHYQRRFACGKQVGLHNFHMPSQPEPRDVLAGARQRTRVLVGGNDAFDATARQHRSQHAGAGTDIEGQLRRGQRRCIHQLDVFAAHRREHAVVRVDARTQAWDLDAFLAPLVRTDQPEQLAQRDDRGPSAFPIRFDASLPHIRRTAQRDTVVAIQRDQDHRQRARALRLRLAVQMERLAGYL